MTFDQWLDSVPGRRQQYDQTEVAENRMNNFITPYQQQTGNTDFMRTGDYWTGTGLFSKGGQSFVGLQPDSVTGGFMQGSPVIGNVQTDASGNLFAPQGLINADARRIEDNGLSDFFGKYGPLLAMGGGVALAGLAGAGAAGAAGASGGAATGATGGSGLAGSGLSAWEAASAPSLASQGAWGAATGEAGLGGLSATGAATGATGALGAANYAPVVEMGTQAVTGAGGAGLAPTGASTFGIPNNLLLGGLQAGLGYLGSNAQADAYKDVAAQQGEYGAPYRALLQQSYQPGFDLWSQPGYEDAANRAADISTRQWAARAGNPAGNPTAQAGIYKDVLAETFLPTLSNYRGQLGQFSGLGLNQSGQASMAAAQQTGGGYNALGYGLNTILNPPSSDADILRKYGLTIGGVSP